MIIFLFPALPTVFIKQQSYTTVYGDPILLECHIISNPPATLMYWIRTLQNVTSIINYWTVCTSGISVNNASLVLTFPVFNDIGSYTCCVSNIVGTQRSKSITLNVIGRTYICNTVFEVRQYLFFKLEKK